MSIGPDDRWRRHRSAREVRDLLRLVLRNVTLFRLAGPGRCASGRPSPLPPRSAPGRGRRRCHGTAGGKSRARGCRPLQPQLERGAAIGVEHRREFVVGRDETRRHIRNRLASGRIHSLPALLIHLPPQVHGVVKDPADDEHCTVPTADQEVSWPADDAAGREGVALRQVPREHTFPSSGRGRCPTSSGGDTASRMTAISTRYSSRASAPN